MTGCSAHESLRQFQDRSAFAHCMRRLFAICGLAPFLTAPLAAAQANTNQSAAWCFRNHVQPVLAKAACSSGACHGAAAGQGGFKLSLRGYDDEGDWRAITRNALGRRIVPTDPARSLLLLKPTTAVPHKGGKRFEVDSLEYKILSEWIAAGAPAPQSGSPRITRLEISPEHVTLSPSASQQLTAHAHFSDGSVQDVTRWVKYTDANAAVTQVDEQGKVAVMGFGEGAITAWYLSRIAIATVTVPYTKQVAPEVFAKAPRRNFIDDLVLEKLQELNLPPSPRCTDEEFIRRAFLDTIGTPPTADEVRAFISESDHSPLTPALSPPRGEGAEATAPRSRPLGPVPRAGEPGRRLNQSHITCASASELKFVVSENCGTCLKNGSAFTLFPPGPDHGAPRSWVMMLLVKVTWAMPCVRTSFSAS